MYAMSSVYMHRNYSKQQLSKFSIFSGVRIKVSPSELRAGLGIELIRIDGRVVNFLPSQGDRYYAVRETC